MQGQKNQFKSLLSKLDPVFNPAPFVHANVQYVFQQAPAVIHAIYIHSVIIILIPALVEMDTPEFTIASRSEIASSVHH